MAESPKGLARLWGSIADDVSAEYKEVDVVDPE